MNVLRRSAFVVLAVSTALAVGIALGSGPLQNRFTDASETRSGSPVRSGVAAMPHGQRLSAAVTSGTATRLLQGRLSGRTVTVVVLPRAPAAAVTGIVAALGQAGALDPLVARLSADVVDPAKKTYVDSVALSALQHRRDIESQAGSDTYQRIGAVLARAYVGSGGDTSYDAEAQDIDAELQGAKIVRLGQPPVRRGELVVLVAPRTFGGGQYAAASRVIEAQLVAAMSAQSDGAVLVAAASHSRDSVSAGWPPGARRGLPLSTLNVVTGPATPVTAVYALLAAADGKPGDFGIIGDSVRLPPGLAVAGS